MERLPVHALEVFLTIVREGSMRAAARALGVGAPAVSLQLKSLEERLGIELFIRTTRRLELTDAGRTLFAASDPAHRQLLDAIEQTQALSNMPAGTLRLSMSRGAYLAAVAPILPDFLLDYPAIDIDISWQEGLVDIAREGYHAGLRNGDRLEPDMIATRVSDPMATSFFASPAYLERHGRPSKPHELLEHRCIRYREPSSGKLRDWTAVENGHDIKIDPDSPLVFDEVFGVIQAARDGLGIGWSMHITAEDYLASGQLEPILAGYSKSVEPFFIYYPRQNRHSECLRLFVQALKSNIRSAKDA